MNILINLGWNSYFIKDVDAKFIDKLMTARRIENAYVAGEVQRYFVNDKTGPSVEVASPALEIYTDKEIDALKANAEQKALEAKALAETLEKAAAVPSD